MLVILYYMLATGKIITKSTFTREIARERLRADEWKETALSKDVVNTELLKQNGRLIPLAQQATSRNPVTEQTVGSTDDLA